MVMFSIQQKDEVSETWYKERVYELTSDLFQSPRYVFELIFDLQSSRFCAAAAMIKEKIEELLKDQYEQDVCDKLNRLLNIVQNSTVNEEKAEALVYCGLVNAEIQDTNAAANYLRQWLVHYLPGTHEYVMARWILGLVLASEPKFTAEMEKHMQACEGSIKVLKERADHQNLPVPCRWYDITGEAMRRVHRKLAANPA
jgi:hypothetical protein